MVEEKIRQLYQIVDELEAAYPEKHFTLDGILLGNLGEVYAAEKYKLKLLPEASKTHDAITVDGKHVQIKVTQGRQIGVSGSARWYIFRNLLWFRKSSMGALWQETEKRAALYLYCSLD